MTAPRPDSIKRKLYIASTLLSMILIFTFAALAFTDISVPAISALVIGLALREIKDMFLK